MFLVVLFSQSYKFIPHISVCVRLILFRQMRRKISGKASPFPARSSQLRLIRVMTKSHSYSNNRNVELIIRFGLDDKLPPSVYLWSPGLALDILNPDYQACPPINAYSI